MSDYYSANNPAWSGYFRIKGRIASLVGMFVVPILPIDKYWWALLAVVLFTCTANIACELKHTRVPLTVACLGSFTVGCLVSRLVESILLQVLIGFAAVALGTLLVSLKSWNDDANAEPARPAAGRESR